MADHPHSAAGLRDGHGGLTAGPRHRARQQGLIEKVQRGLSCSAVDADLLPISVQLAPLFGGRGLPLGTTVLIAGGRGPGATSLGLGLCAEVTQESLYAGVVNCSRAGLVGASELGVALDHLVFISRPTERVAKVAAAMMESCLLVVIGSDRPVARRDAEQLQRRAREHRCVLLVLDAAVGRKQSFWTGVPDITLVVAETRAIGIGCGTGALVTRELTVEVRYRRLPPQQRPPVILLPAPKTSRPPVEESTPISSVVPLVS